MYLIIKWFYLFRQCYQKGIYQFVVSHAMRDTILAGMHDVGMTIQKLD